MSELFCAKVITEVMPSVRSFVSNKLSNLGLRQEKISDLLNVSQPAISQYRKQIRGSMYKTMEDNYRFSSYLNGLSQDVMAKRVDLNSKTCDICKKARESQVLDREEFFNKLCLLKINFK